MSRKNVSGKDVKPPSEETACPGPAQDPGRERESPPDAQEGAEEAQAGAAPQEGVPSAETPSDRAARVAIEDLKEELDHAKDRVLRVQAELENYRKRAARELADERRYAHMPLLRDLLPVLDNMYRAIEAAEKSLDLGALLEGMRMVVEQFRGVLERHHCREIPAQGEPFDPNVHEAIAQQAASDVPPNTVIHVAQTGFVLHDRVVRPTQVVVSVDPGATS